MSILFRLLPFELSPGSREVRRVPVTPVLVNGRLKLADVLGGRVDLQVNEAINVHPVVGLLRGGIEEVHHGYFVRAEITLQKLVRKVKPELGGAHPRTLPGPTRNTGTNSYRPDRIHNPYDFSYNTAYAQSVDPLCGSGKQSLACFFNPAAFRAPLLAPGQLSAHVFGNGGNGNLRGPEVINFDIAMLKEFRVTERHRLQLRAEFFNIANTPNFALPGGTVDVAGGAAVTSTLSDNQREIQFALKWTF